MLDLRQTCEIIAGHTGVPDVNQWAAALQGAGILPKDEQPVDENQAAALLLVVMGSVAPAGAPGAFDDVTNAVLEGAYAMKKGDGFDAFERIEINDQHGAGSLHFAIETVAQGIVNHRTGGAEIMCINKIAVQHGTGLVLVDVATQMDGLIYNSRLSFFNGEIASVAGMKLTTEISGDVLQSLAQAMSGESPHSVTEPVQSTAVH